MSKNNDIKKPLIEEYGYSEDDLKGKKRPTLEKMLEQCRSVEIDENEVEVEDNVNSASSNDMEDTDGVPCIGSVEWNDYVLSLFEKKELEDDKYPKVDALRRIATNLFGLFDSETVVVQSPSTENSGRATVVVKTKFHNKEFPISTSGAADVFVGNTVKPFGNHPVATAETRAEGRALRKALRLTTVLSAEEMHNITEEDEGSQKIAKAMVTSLTVMCDRLGISLPKMVKYQYETEDINSLTQDNGIEISKKLCEYQNNKASGKDIIPNEIKQ